MKLLFLIIQLSLTSYSQNKINYNLLVISQPSGAHIIINKKPTTYVTPVQILVPANKEYTIELKKDGYYAERKSMVTTKVGGEVRFKLRKK